MEKWPPPRAASRRAGVVRYFGLGLSVVGSQPKQTHAVVGARKSTGAFAPVQLSQIGTVQLGKLPTSRQGLSQMGQFRQGSHDWWISPTIWWISTTGAHPPHKGRGAQAIIVMQKVLGTFRSDIGSRARVVSLTLTTFKTLLQPCFGGRHA